LGVITLLNLRGLRQTGTVMTVPVCLFRIVHFACSASDDVTALYIELEPGRAGEVKERWRKWWSSVPLVLVPSPYRSIVGPLLEFLDETDALPDDG